jgi:ATP-binding cassette subfamily B (MDR/TAP) protein 1
MSYIFTYGDHAFKNSANNILPGWIDKIKTEHTTTNHTIIIIIIIMKLHKRNRNDHQQKQTHQTTTDTVIDDPQEPKIKSPIYVCYIVRCELLYILLGLLGAAFIGSLPILLYLVLGNLIDSLTPTGSGSGSTSPIIRDASTIVQNARFQSDANNNAKWMAIIAAGAFAGALLQNLFLNLAHDHIGTRLKTAYFSSLLDQEVGYFDRKQTGGLVNEMTESMEIVQDAFSTKLGEFVKNIVQCVLGIILALVAGWKMALVMLSCAPLLALLLGGSGILVRVFSKKVSQINEIAANVANEVISSIRTVRSMDGEEKEKKRFNSSLRKAHPVYLVKSVILGLSLGFAFFSIWSVVALAFWYGSRQVVRREITIGDMFQVFGFVIMSVMGLAGALQILPDFGKAYSAVINLLKVIKRSPALPPSGGTAPNKIEGNLEFVDVTFSYPSRPNVQVIKNLSLSIKPGQKIALVGASGSGKSTIVGLIEKFYAPDSGKILLDGTDLAQIDPRWLHRNISIVTQEPTLFATTIKQNILYAVEDTGREVSDEELYAAARAANAHDFITAFPDGYDTKLGERGIALSGGQKQRIAIARAMIQNPSLLLLDEATSALDTQSESLVQEALTRLMENRTAIVIAHRLSTVVDSDVICVLNKGELKEMGTHTELLKIADGFYFKLAAKQMMFGQRSTSVESDHSSEEQNEEAEILEAEISVGDHDPQATSNNNGLLQQHSNP